MPRRIAGAFALLALAVALLGPGSARAEIEVLAMPDSVPARPYAWVGRELPVWGRVSGGTPPYEFTWSFGDASPPVSGPVTSKRQILFPHVYGTTGTHLARLVVTDSAGESGSATVRIDVVDRPETARAEVNAAIQDGLRYLYLNQYRGGSRDGAWYAGPYAGGGYAAGAAMGALAFEEQGHRPAPAGTGVYAETIRRALEALFRLARPVTVDAASDAHNGNGGGVGFYSTPGRGQIYRMGYECGMALLGMVGSGTPDAVISTGPLAGRTYRYAVEEAVDWCAWAQESRTRPNNAGCANPQGGWRYGANYQTSDNSVTQWPAIGLEAAESWGVEPPPFVKQRLDGWLQRSQNAGGGFGYCSSSAVNFARSAGGFCGLAYLGMTPADPRMRRALDSFARSWTSSGYDGNFANLYAMYGFAKGARIASRSVPIRRVGGVDWYDAYSSWLVPRQSYSLSGGSFWSAFHRYLSDSPPHFGTILAVLILTPGEICWPPLARAGDDLTVPPETDVLLDGSGSYHQDPEGRLTLYEWDLDGDGVADLTGPRPVVEGGWPRREEPYRVTVTLTVRGTTARPGCEDWQVASDEVEVTVDPDARPSRLSGSLPLEERIFPGQGVSWTLRLQAAGGDPIAGATIPVRAPGLGVSEDLATDEAGEAVFSWSAPAGQAAGAFELSIGPAYKPGILQSNAIRRYVSVGGDLFLRVEGGSATLAPGESAEWTVRVSDGAGVVAGASLLVEDGVAERTEFLETGADGTAIWPLTVPADAPPGSRSLLFGPATFEGYRGSGRVARSVWVPGPIALENAGPERVVTSPGDVVSLAVRASLGPAGDPVVRAEVPVEDELRGLSTRVWSDLTGTARYEVEVPSWLAAGEYTLTFGPARKERHGESEPVEVQVVIEDRLRLDVLPGRATASAGDRLQWRALVRDAAGEPVEGATLAVSDPISGDVVSLVTGAGGVASHETAVPRGVAAGVAEISFGPAAAAGYRLSGQVRVPVRTLAAGQPAALEGAVRSLATGLPLPGARVRLRDPGGEEREAVAGAEGGFAFSGLPSGTWTAVASAEGYRDAERSIALKPDVTRASFWLRRPPVGPRPEVLSVRSRYSRSGGRAIFLDGVSVPLELTVEADWNGLPPGRYVFTIVDSRARREVRSIESLEPALSLDVGRELGPAGRLRVHLVAAGEKERMSPAVDAGFEVAPGPPEEVLPIALRSAALGSVFPELADQLTYRWELTLGLPVIDMTERRVPASVPFVGGKGVAFRAELELEASMGTDGVLSFHAAAERSGRRRDAGGRFAPEWKLFGLTFRPAAKAGVEVAYDEGRDEWRFDSGELRLSARGESSFGPWYHPLPPIPPIPPLPGYLRGRIAVDAAGALRAGGLAAGELQWEGAFEPLVELTGAGGVGVYQALSVELSATLLFLLRLAWEPAAWPLEESFRKLEVSGRVDATVTALLWQETFPLWEYPPWCLVGPECEGAGGGGGGDASLAPDAARPMGRWYLEPAARGPSGRGRGAGAGGTDRLVIDETAFPEARPAIAPLSDGALLVWARDDGTRPEENRTAIAFSRRRGGAWSAPEVLDADGTADFTPRLAAVHGGAIAVWQDLAEPLPEGASLSEALPLAEISAARYEEATGEWSSPMALTGDRSLDRSPALAASVDRALLVWVKNRDGAMLGTPESPDEIWWSARDRSGWRLGRSAAAGVGGVVDGDLAWDGERGDYVFVLDADGRAETGDDHDLAFLELEGGTWSAPRRLTRDDVPDAMPRVALLEGGRSLLLWRRGGDLVACRDLDVGAARPLPLGLSGGGSLELSLAGGGAGPLTLLESRATLGGSDVFARVASASGEGWSAPVRLTSDLDRERFLAGCWSPSGELLVATGALELGDEVVEVPLEGETIEVTAPVPVASRVVVLERLLTPELSVAPEAVELEEAGAGAGERRVSAVVRNDGLVPADPVIVTFRYGAPGGERLAGDVDLGALDPGQSAKASAALPLSPPGADGLVCVRVDPDQLLGESRRDDNAACRELWHSRLEIASVEATRDGRGSITLRVLVQNRGDVPAEPAWLEGFSTPQGMPSLAEANVPALDAGHGVERDLALSAEEAEGRERLWLRLRREGPAGPEGAAIDERWARWPAEPGVRFVRGALEGRGRVGMADAIRIFGFLFLGRTLGTDCLDVADANDDGRVDLSDGVTILNYLYLGGDPPRPPWPEPGFDTTADDLGCPR